MALFIIVAVFLTGYSLSLSALGVLTGMAVAIGLLIYFDEKRHPSMFSGAGMFIAFKVMALGCAWLTAVLVRILHAPPFPWRACLNASIWFCQHILFR